MKYLGQFVDTLEAKWIIPELNKAFPTIKTYVEPFGGAYSVGLQRLPSKVEVYNDLNPKMVNLYRQIKENVNPLVAALNALPMNKATYQWAITSSTNKLEEAVKYYANCQLNYTGGGLKNIAGVSEIRIKRPDTKSHNHLYAISERIQNLEIKQQDALEVIKQYDSGSTLFYVDPPYPLTVRNSNACYEHELSLSQHSSLLDALNQAKGMIAVSGYDHPLYCELLNGWTKLTRLSRTTSHKLKTEVLWINK